jgi:lipoprotein NlpI
VHIVFKFLRRFASQADPDPRAAALRLLARGDAAAAEPALSSLLEDAALAPSERAFLINKRGVARIALGRRADARVDFEAALALLPKHAPALVNVGNLTFEEGRVDEAVALYEEAIRADEFYHVAHLNLAAAYKRLGRLEDAVRAIRTARRLEGRSRRAQSRRE